MKKRCVVCGGNSDFHNEPLCYCCYDWGQDAKIFLARVGNQMRRWEYVGKIGFGAWVFQLWKSRQYFTQPVGKYRWFGKHQTKQHHQNGNNE